MPQGSSLGPLLLILYINDLPNASELTDPLLFADDTSILYSHSNPNCLESLLNDELQNSGVWLKCNKLSVNLKKTNYVILNPDRRHLTPAFLSPLEVNPYNNLTQLNSLGSILMIIPPENTISAMYVNKSLNQ